MATAEKLPEDDVKIYAPDRSLQVKIGAVNLEQTFNAKVVAAAEQVIVKSADEFYDDSLVMAGEISRVYDEIRKAPAVARPLVEGLIEKTFALKTKTGQGGYALVSKLARSLQYHCEEVSQHMPTPRDLQIIGWHTSAILNLLTGHLKGDGGPTGEAIIAELRQILPGRDL